MEITRADLHLHSNYSDGRLNPSEVVKWAVKESIKAISLTDHMAVGGLEETRKEAQKQDIEFIHGIELNTHLYRKRLHILAYGFDLGNKDFLRVIQYWQKIQTKRIVKTVERLIDLGFDISFEEVLKTKAEYLDLYHLYQTLVQKEKNRQKIAKEVSPIVDLFETIDGYFGRGKPARLTRQKNFNTLDALQAVKKANGVAVLAHPGMHLGYQNDNIIVELKKYGLRGVEAISGHHTWDQICHYQRLAAHHRFLITGGSDFHARLELNGCSLDSPLGYYHIPYKVYSDLKKYLK